jgi:hypothetical protein
MNELDQLLSLVGDGVTDSVRGSNFDSFEEAESMESYIMRKQMADRRTANMKLSQIKGSGRLNDLRAQMKQEPNYGATGGTLKQGDQFESVGQFDLTAKRATANIASVLPIAFLSPQMLQSNYNQVIQIGSGITLAITGGYLSGKPNQVDFTYTQGANVDVITITTGDSALAYPSFLAACQTDKFRASNIRYIVGDESAPSLAQFKNSVQFFEATTFGKVSSNKLSANSYRDPKNFAKNIIDVVGQFTFDKSKGFWVNMNATANLEFTLSMFLEKTYQDSSKGF